MLLLNQIYILFTHYKIIINLHHYLLKLLLNISQNIEAPSENREELKREKKEEHKKRVVCDHNAIRNA